MVGSLRAFMALHRQSCCISRCRVGSHGLARIGVPAVAAPPQCRNLVTQATMYEPDAPRVNIYTDYTIYKGSSAMSLKVIKPTWERVATGSGIKMSRDGVLLLEFATSKGEREYDWEGKQNFALSATECAEVLEAVETGTAKNFFHDPNKMGIGEGFITKSLRVTPARETGWFFSLSVNQRDSGAIKFDTILSNAELRVIRTLMNFAIPRLLGFDEVFAASPPDLRQSAPSPEMSFRVGGRGFEGDEPPF